MPLVADHMSSDLLTVAAADRLGEAAKRMVARGVGAVLVLDADEQDVRYFGTASSLYPTP